MKQYELQAITKRLNQFLFISKARRVGDNIIELVFDKSQSYFFSLTRGHSLIYKANSQRPLQDYNAPFDTLLHSLLSGSKLLEVTTPHNDRVIRFKIAPKSSYKDKIIYFQLEFTGKNTNAILINSEEMVIEALRHIDSDSSFRIVRPSYTLLSIPLQNNKKEEKEVFLEDIDSYLENIFQKIERKKFLDLKKQKMLSIEKKIEKFNLLLAKLPNQKILSEQALEYQNNGNLILANLYQIKPYDKHLKTYDFNGQEVSITLPKNLEVNRISDYYFNLSKRAKNKAKNIHIEKENLVSKKSFYKNIAFALEQATLTYEIELLVPKRAKSLRKKEKLKEGELFWIEGYKVMVGRNSNENQALLGIAKSNDIWMHIRGIPSSHVIIKTDKQNLPDSVIESASKLCVDFSLRSAGDYDVDFTKRKFVKLQEGSNVVYDKYQTIRVRKEGVEIRV